MKYNKNVHILNVAKTNLCESLMLQIIDSLHIVILSTFKIPNFIMLSRVNPLQENAQNNILMTANHNDYNGENNSKETLLTSLFHLQLNAADILVY